MEQIRKVFTGEIIQKAEGKPIIAVVSTASVDLAGDVIHQDANDHGKGWILDKFNKSPRGFWMHDSFNPNLYAGGKAWLEDGQLMFSPVFDDGDEFAMFLDGKYRRGSLTEWSVGFTPKVSVNREEDNNGWHQPKDFYEQVLDEISPVNFGCNPDTETPIKAHPRYTKVDEFAGQLHQLEERIQGIEAALMKANSENDEQGFMALKEALEALRTARTGV